MSEKKIFREENATELYYRTMVGREARLKRLILGHFYAISSLPRLLIEVFLRPNMGERYFKLSAATWLTVILAFLPAAITRGLQLGVWGYITGFPSWYVFLAVFTFFSFRRYKEVRRKSAVFNFDKLTTYSGDILPFFEKFKNKRGATNYRLVEIYLEPLPFLIAGLILLMVGQILGTLFIVCAVIYSLAYSAAYMIGDDFVLDLIDKQHYQKMIKEDFVSDEHGNAGPLFRGRKPGTRQYRQHLWDDQNVDDAEFEVV